MSRKKEGVLVHCPQCDEITYKRPGKKGDFCSSACANKYSGPSRRKLRPSKEILEELYVNQKLSPQAISLQIKRSKSIIVIALKEYGIPIRHDVVWNRNLTKETDEKLAIIGRKVSVSNKGRKAWNKGLIIKTALVTYICLECGIKFQGPKNKSRKFCCIKHSMLYLAKHNRVSSLERKVKQIFELLSLKEKEDYIPQFPLNGWIVDFYLPKLKAIIECDGNYWHNLPNRQEMDLKKDIWFIQNNYDILRLKENLIKNETDNCKRTIKDCIGVNYND